MPKYKHMLHIRQRTKYSGEQLNSLSTLYVGTSVLRWAGWATVKYGRVQGKLKTRVRKRIWSNKCFPTLAWNPTGVPDINKLWVTRSTAVARMANRTAPVVKLTLAGHNLAKTGTSPFNGPIMKQHEAYRTISCTLKTIFGVIFLLLVVWSDLATNRKWAGLISKTIPAICRHLEVIYTFVGQ